MYLYHLSVKCLKGEVSKAERRVEELMELRREEQVGTTDTYIYQLMFLHPAVYRCRVPVKTGLCVCVCVLVFTGEHKECCSID